MRHTPALMLGALTACSRPLDEGGYEVTVTDIPVNECQVEESSLGAGATLPVTVSWAGDALLLGGFGPDQEWTWDGADGFATTWEETDTSSETCERTSAFSMDGLITSSASFTIAGAIAMDFAGDCEGLEGASCATEVQYEGLGAK